MVLIVSKATMTVVRLWLAKKGKDEKDEKAESKQIQKNFKIKVNTPKKQSFQWLLVLEWWSNTLNRWSMHIVNISGGRKEGRGTVRFTDRSQIRSKCIIN